MIRRERLTPVLGPGLADAILGSRQDVARRWVRRWQMPIAVHNQGDLAQVAQYLRVSHAQNVVREALIDLLRTELLERMRRAHPGELYDLSEDLVVDTPEQALHEVGRRQREADPGEPYRVLAALPAAIYVTTGWTDLLQDALMERMPQRTPTTLMFPWNARYGVRQPEVLEEPTVANLQVYHLFGRLEEPRSLVLTEDDYFTWLKARIERRDTVPPVVKEALTLRSLLFLGYRLDDWDFRVVFQSIKSFEGSEELLRENLHAGVQLSPENQAIEPESAQEYLESYFGKNQISLYWGNTRTFLDELRERTGIAT
jgi:SIR2-like domain